MIKDWMPRRKFSDRHRFVYHSDNHKIYAGIGSDIYSVHVEIGPLSIMWESKGSRTNWGM